MKGSIKVYSDAVGAGLIVGEDGKIYSFSQSDWNGQQAPAQNERVEFVNEAMRAKKIMVASSKLPNS